MKKFFIDLETLITCGGIAYILLRIVESLYRWSNMKSDIDDIIEWRIYDENTKLLEIGIVESTVKGKEVSWYVEV